MGKVEHGGWQGIWGSDGYEMGQLEHGRKDGAERATDTSVSVVMRRSRGRPLFVHDHQPEHVMRDAVGDFAGDGEGTTERQGRYDGARGTTG